MFSSSLHSIFGAEALELQMMKWQSEPAFGHPHLPPLLVTVFRCCCCLLNVGQPLCSRLWLPLQEGPHVLLTVLPHALQQLGAAIGAVGLRSQERLGSLLFHGTHELKKLAGLLGF